MKPKVPGPSTKTKADANKASGGTTATDDKKGGEGDIFS